VHRHCNSTKTNRTAYDFIVKKGEDAVNAYVKRVDEWYKNGIISYGKMLRLKVSYEEYLERKINKKETEADKKLWENFLDRDLRATQYISRKSREILQVVCKNVTATEGKVTATLRKLWGWEDVLMNLQLPKYKERSLTVIKEWESEYGRRKHQKEEIVNWTKRDDHRHHAIDALVIACTQQGFIQRINTLSSSEVKDEMKREIDQAKKNYSERLTLLDKYLISKKPFSTSEVEKEADKILVSFKSGKKVATISKYKAIGKNKETGVIVPRGALHEQSTYGKIKTNGIENSVLKYKVQSLKLNQIEDIVDKKVRELVKERVKQCNNNLIEAFKNTLWFNEKKQIPILSVRIYARPDANTLVPIKKDEYGKDIGFVLTGNNHHIAIYTNSKNELIEHPCTFWHAVERKKAKIPIIIKNTNDVIDQIQSNIKSYSDIFFKQLPDPHLQLKISLQQNEMFVLGMSDEEFQTAYAENNKSLISKCLYLVWSISHNDYWFRHHLETKNTELKNIEEAKESMRYFRFKSLKSLMEKNPIKVRINHLGEITKIGEY
jgi:CRISPR-associated endonuclease Csn1